MEVSFFGLGAGDECVCVLIGTYLAETKQSDQDTLRAPTGRPGWVSHPGSTFVSCSIVYFDAFHIFVKKVLQKSNEKIRCGRGTLSAFFI